MKDKTYRFEYPKPCNCFTEKDPPQYYSVLNKQWVPHGNISTGNTMETLSDKGKLQNNIYKIDKIDNALASLVKKKIGMGREKIQINNIKNEKGVQFQRKANTIR